MQMFFFTFAVRNSKPLCVFQLCKTEMDVGLDLTDAQLSFIVFKQRIAFQRELFANTERILLTRLSIYYNFLHYNLSLFRRVPSDECVYFISMGKQIDTYSVEILTMVIPSFRLIACVIV